jgi:acetyltransferase-like isoleucine patch superfamily enzyme
MATQANADGREGAREGRRLPWDWHPGVIPANVVIDEAAHVETSYSFCAFRSRAAVGVEIGAGASTYGGTMFDVGPRGRVSVGRCVMVNGAQIVCDERVEIGDYALISWNVVIMDTYRVPTDPALRRRYLEHVARSEPRGLPLERDERVVVRPVRVGSNVWIGFDTCVLPGVTIGEGSVVGAKSVGVADVEPYSVVGGNPARVLRRLEPLRGSAEDVLQQQKIR